MQRWREAELEAVGRLDRRYELLQNLIRSFWESRTKADSSHHYPPLEQYLSALEVETQGKTFAEMTHFVDAELAKALSNFSSDHPLHLQRTEGFKVEAAKLAPKILEHIQQGDDFETLMQFLATNRRRIAQEVVDVPTEQFGAWRQPDPGGILASVTHEGSLAPAFRQRFFDLVPEGTKAGVFNSAFMQRMGPQWVDILDSQTAWTTLEGHLVPLTVYLRANESPLYIAGDLPNRSWVDWLFNGKLVGEIAYPAVCMLHTDPAQFSILKRHCQQLYDQFRAAAGREALLHIGAQLHWHLSHATFFRRGSASTAEWLMAALFLFKGHPIRWLLKPDLEVLATPRLEDFLPIYPTTLKFQL